VRERQQLYVVPPLELAAQRLDRPRRAADVELEPGHVERDA
jgi:hypothetical protein